MGIFLTNLIEGAASIYIIIIIVRVLMTWFREEIVFRYRAFFNMVAAITDPLLVFIRRIFPAAAGRIDFSPLIAVFAVLVLKSMLIFFINMFFYRAPLI